MQTGRAHFVIHLKGLAGMQRLKYGLNVELSYVLVL